MSADPSKGFGEETRVQFVVEDMAGMGGAITGDGVLARNSVGFRRYVCGARDSGVGGWCTWLVEGSGVVGNASGTVCGVPCRLREVVTWAIVQVVRSRISDT